MGISKGEPRWKCPAVYMHARRQGNGDRITHIPKDGYFPRNRSDRLSSSPLRAKVQNPKTERAYIPAASSGEPIHTPGITPVRSVGFSPFREGQPSHTRPGGRTSLAASSGTAGRAHIPGRFFGHGREGAHPWPLLRARPGVRTSPAASSGTAGRADILGRFFGQTSKPQEALEDYRPPDIPGQKPSSVFASGHGT